MESILKPNWFKERKYKHFDVPVCLAFAARITPSFVISHPFSPFIYYVKEEKRYKKKENKTIIKQRPIMYASHRDACILSYYANDLGERLNNFYEEQGIGDNVIAYRALKKGNYDFAAEAYDFAKKNSPVTILAFDVTGFFDNLDHALLKERLKRILKVTSLSEDWYRVLRYITRFRFVSLDDLKAHPIFGDRIKTAKTKLIASTAELKAAGIKFHKNPKTISGIPQGTPISATISNLYMIDFDVAARSFCDKIGGMYRRYSDDILVICKTENAAAVEAKILSLIGNEKLELSVDKTERVVFDRDSKSFISSRSAQYLGFTMHKDGAVIRSSSLSRQWRKMRRAFKRIRKIAEAEILAGRADKAYTKKLRRRFTALQFRNFSSYGRRSAAAFGGDEKIMKQIRRFEREAESQLNELKTIKKST